MADTAELLYDEIIDPVTEEIIDQEELVGRLLVPSACCRSRSGGQASRGGAGPGRRARGLWWRCRVRVTRRGSPSTGSPSSARARSDLDLRAPGKIAAHLDEVCGGECLQ